ncbi:MAG: TatD family hydrolase [Ruminococcus sp.]|nr:TatD family hydrolase [Ruminococcus sp.]
MQYHSIFDSHSHYTDDAFDVDRDTLMASLPDAGVCGVMLASASADNSVQSVQLAERYPFCWCAVGVHPESEADTPDDYLHALRSLAAHEKVLAIGEIGLDYHYDNYCRERQIRLFREQLMLAQELDLPVIIHSRDATADCMEILREFRPRGVMHCFSGSAETARELVALGMYVGFTGVLTFKNARKSIEAMHAVPMDRLLLETDCPYMAPVPYRGKRCDSTMIPLMAERVAEERGISAQDVLIQTAENTKRLFGIG